MKKQILLFILGIVLASFAFIGFKSGNNACTTLVVSKVELQMDSLKAKLMKDTVSVIYITMKNMSKVPLKGPDYVLLRVIQGKDTIAGVAINGIPLYGKPRSYPVFCKKRIKTLPDLKTLRISLETYCDNIKILQK